MVGKYFTELRHFGVIRDCGGLWEVTELGIGFLQGSARIPAWTWPKEETLPEECVDGPLRHVHELTGEHPKETKARHVEESVSAENS